MSGQLLSQAVKVVVVALQSLETAVQVEAVQA
jgi:hypothetical protein